MDEIEMITAIVITLLAIAGTLFVVNLTDKECPTIPDRTIVCKESTCNCNITMPPPVICPEGKQVRTKGLDTCIKVLQEQRHIDDSLESAIKKYRQ